MSYIKIHRELIDSYAFANPKHLKIWLWLLMKANYKNSFALISTGRGEMTIEVKRGQMIFGRFKAEEELEIEATFIRRTLQKFEELGQIKMEMHSHFTIITICKYDSYQSSENESAQALHTQCPSNDQAMPNTCPPHAHHVPTSKEGLEFKEFKEDITIPDLKNSNLFREPIVPTFDQVHEVFIRSGGTKEMAEKFYNKYDSVGWYLNNSPIKNFVTLANNFITNYKTNENGKQSKKSYDTAADKFNAYHAYATRLDGEISKSSENL
jgi:hypothetical protein